MNRYVSRAKYLLDCTPNIDDIRHWAIYKDFLTICRSGNVPAIRQFHDEYILHYEADLRAESPTLTFTDIVHYNPHFPEYAAVRINEGIYLRLMGTAYCTLKCNPEGTPEPVIHWFAQTAAENLQLK